MIKVKVSTPWDHIDFKTRIPSDPESGFRFYFDGEEEAFDFWIVWGGIKGMKESAICPKENVVYLTDEVHEERFFNKHFIDQFMTVITCRKDLEHRNIIYSHELNTWMIQKSYDTLYASDKIEKTKIISVVSSDQTWLAGHKRRFAFVNKLAGHFKDRLDVFGRGIRPVKDKYEALAPYKYSIAIENSAIPGYFTEKITDCYLTHTMPLYFGCPDITDYFDPGSLLLIDPDNFKGSVAGIERLLEEDPYDVVLPLLKTQKIKYLESYHIFNRLCQLLQQFKPAGIKQKVTVRAEASFKRGYDVNRILSKGAGLLHLPNFQINFSQADQYANKKNKQ